MTPDAIERLMSRCHADGVRSAVNMIRLKRNEYTLDEILEALEQTANLRDPHPVYGDDSAVEDVDPEGLRWRAAVVDGEEVNF